MIDVDKKKITCSYDDLKRFARGEMVFNEIIDFGGLNFDLDAYAVKFEKHYDITFDDLYEAVRNFSNSFVDGVEFYYNWAQPFSEVMTEALNLPKLLGCTQEDFVNELYRYEAEILFITETDIWMKFFSELLWMDEELDELLHMDYVQMHEYFGEIICKIDNARYNSGKELLEHRLTKRQKKSFVYAYRSDAHRNLLSDVELCLYRKLLEELCEDMDISALEIKAHACYGKGSLIYKSDWNTSKLCLLKIIKCAEGMKKASAAKLLGNIYYFGRIEETVDYEKAFYYYSIAYFGGEEGASCRIGDVLFGSNHALINDEAAYKLYWKSYVRGMIDFHDGKIMCSFADAAYGLGKYYDRKGGGYIFDSFKYYLQAKTALDVRMRRCYVEVADDEIMLKDIERRIEKQNKEIENTLVNYSSDNMNLFVLDLLVDLFADFVELEDFKVNIEFENSDNFLKIRFNRMYLNNDRKWKVMVSSKCIPFSKITDSLVLRVENRPYLTYGKGVDVNNLVADAFDCIDGVLCFYMNDYLVLEISPAEFLFYIEDQK